MRSTAGRYDKITNLTTFNGELYRRAAFAVHFLPGFPLLAARVGERAVKSAHGQFRTMLVALGEGFQKIDDPLRSQLPGVCERPAFDQLRYFSFQSGFRFSKNA
jgi:hypothetical protein